MPDLPRRPRRVPIVPVLMALLLGGTGAAVHAQQQLQFFLSIVDESGDPVTDIAEGDLRIFEDGVAGKTVSLERIDWPVRVQLLVDNGMGMGAENLLHIRNGVRGFFDALPEGVEASLLTIAPQPRTIVRTTSDREALRGGADLIAPDPGASKFIDAIIEAGSRIERERARATGGNHFPVLVIVASTGPEGSSTRERDVNRTLQRFTQTGSTVHAVVVTTGARSQNEVSGTRQTIIGLEATERTGGRYEAIAAPSRLSTLLPEIARQIATSHDRQSQQYRVTFERPEGKTGVPGHFELNTLVTGVSVRGSFDGRIP